MRITAILITLALISLNTRPAIAADVTLGANPTMGGGIFTSGGGISIAVEGHMIGGQPHLCGVWAQSNVISAYVTTKIRDVLETGVVQSGSVTILRDFRGFRRVEPANTYQGAQAKCVVVQKSAANFKVRFPKQTLEKGRGQSSAVQVDFKPSRKINPAHYDGSIKQKDIFSASENKRSVP